LTAYLSSHDRIKLKPKVDGKVLHQYLFDLLEKYNAKKINDTEIEKRIKTEIEKFIE
jgi:hypothetical protein